MEIERVRYFWYVGGELTSAKFSDMRGLSADDIATRIAEYLEEKWNKEQDND